MALLGCSLFFSLVFLVFQSKHFPMTGSLLHALEAVQFICCSSILGFTCFTGSIGFTGFSSFEGFTCFTGFIGFTRFSGLVGLQWLHSIHRLQQLCRASCTSCRLQFLCYSKQHIKLGADMAPFREIIILRLASWSYSTRKTSKGPVTYTYSVNMHECWLDLCATASSTRLIKMCLRDSSTLFSKRNVPLIHPIWVRVSDPASCPTF